MDNKHLQVVPTNPLEKIQGLSLSALIEQRKDVERIIEDAGGELSEHVEDLYDNVNALLAGKVDRVAVFVKKVIPSHIEACKQQIRNLEWLEERIKEYTIECIKQAGGGPLSGLSWRARVQANPPSVVIDNPDKIPNMFKRATVVIQCKLDPSDAQSLGYWKEMIERHKASYGDRFSGDIVIEPDKTILKELMSPKEGDPTPVDGAHVERGVHVRFEEGRAKATTPKTKKKKELEQ